MNGILLVVVGVLGITVSMTVYVTKIQLQFPFSVEFHNVRLPRKWTLSNYIRGQGDFTCWKFILSLSWKHANVVSFDQNCCLFQSLVWCWIFYIKDTNTQMWCDRSWRGGQEVTRACEQKPWTMKGGYWAAKDHQWWNITILAAFIHTVSLLIAWSLQPPGLWI